MNREIPEYLEEEWQTAKDEYKVKTTTYITITKFEYEKLQQENKQLKQWDKNKDTRNSRQRVANYELLKENKRLKEENIKLQMKHISVLDEIRKIIETEKRLMGYAIYDSCLLLIEEILDKAGKE